MISYTFIQKHWRHCLPFLFLLMAGCGKTPGVGDVVTDLKSNPAQLDADGSSVATLTVKLNRDASADRRSVVFTANGGTLDSGKNGKAIVAADYVNGELVATTTLTAPISATATDIAITAAPAQTSINSDYTLTTHIAVSKSDPATITLESSSFGIAQNYAGSISLTATLKNAKNKKVSLGAKVKFEDIPDNSAHAPTGRFTTTIASSDSNAQAKTQYSAPALPIGTNVTIKATIMDDNNNPVGTPAMIVITINQ